MQERAVEIAKKYENLPMQDKIGVIAQTFGCTSGKIESSPCFGKWRGTSDISIIFDNGTSLFLANHWTPQAKTVKVQNEYVNIILSQYNPEVVAITKETALTALRKREVRDNIIAAQKGLNPYTLLNVELNNGTDKKSSGYIGWYYVTIAVDGKIHAHLESKLAYEIANGKVGTAPTRDHYYTAGALTESDVDYVFNNVGHSTTSGLYSLPIADDVLERAKRTLAEFGEAQSISKQDISMSRKKGRSVILDRAQPRKPSIKAQLAAAAIDGQLTFEDILRCQSAGKVKNCEVR